MNTLQTVREVDPVTLKSWMDSGKAAAYDVREADEHAREHIPGSRLVPLSRFDPAAISQNGTQAVLYCRSGRRSMEAAQKLLAAGRAEVVHLQGGFEAWRQAGMPAEVNRKVPISIMRQVQITVGAAVLAGSILAWAVSPWFLLLTGFFGAGLLFAGVSGTCALALILGKMPWNRRFAGACAVPTGAGGGSSTRCGAC
jgi:rhodanese-related sulfurtransferase